MRIRSDLVGVVYVQTSGGVVCLEAGDTVPDGAEVGEHLTSEAEEPAAAPEVEETENAGRRRGRRSASRPTTDA